jgi:hypothetical protein
MTMQEFIKAFQDSVWQSAEVQEFAGNHSEEEFAEWWKANVHRFAVDFFADRVRVVV